MKLTAYRHPRPGWTRPRAAVAVGLACLAPAAAGAVLAVAGWLPDPAAFAGPGNAPPSPAHWLGTDVLGRDVASRLGWAAARFAGPASLAVVVALAVGGVLGVAEGLAGPVGRRAGRWTAQALDGVPKLVLVLLAASITRSDLGWTMAVVGLTFAPQVAGAVRASIERLRARAFIEAERCLGVGATRIVLLHILWGHSRRALVSQVTGVLAYAVLVESSLSYLGGALGVQEPSASWGNMLALARDGLFHGAWLPAAAPAAAICVTLLGFRLVGAGLLGALEDRP